MNRERLTPMGRRVLAGMAGAGIEGESELARRIGASRQTVRRWLYDSVVRVDAVTLFRLSDTLRMSARWLLHGHGSPTVRMPLTPDAQRLVEIHESLDEQQRSILLKAATHLITS